jgi:hypothetical protein
MIEGDSFPSGLSADVVQRVMDELLLSRVADLCPLPVEPAPIVLSLAELADLAEQLGPPRPPTRVVMHPLAFRALCQEFPPMDPPPPPGQLQDSCGVPVIEDQDMAPGAWEIRVGDEVIDRGTISPVRRGRQYELDQLDPGPVGLRLQAISQPAEPDKHCPCGHSLDNICLNGLIYGECSSEYCNGACVDVDTCKRLPGCCDEDRQL